METLKHTDGREIHLADTNDTDKLKSQLMLLGMNGLAYSPWWNDIAKKRNKILNTKNPTKTEKEWLKD